MVGVKTPQRRTTRAISPRSKAAESRRSPQPKKNEVLTSSRPKEIEALNSPQPREAEVLSSPHTDNRGGKLSMWWVFGSHLAMVACFTVGLVWYIGTLRLSSYEKSPETWLAFGPAGILCLMVLSVLLLKARSKQKLTGQFTVISVLVGASILPAFSALSAFG